MGTVVLGFIIVLGFLGASGCLHCCFFCCLMFGGYGCFRCMGFVNSVVYLAFICR